MSVAGANEGHGAFARNTSWGGSSNTSWGGSSNTSWGGSAVASRANTSWGGSSSTSWCGGRGRAAMAALAIVLPLLAALPLLGQAVHSQRVVVVGAHASQALQRAGAHDVALLTHGVATGSATPGQSAALRPSGFRGSAAPPIHPDAAPIPQVSGTGRINVRELLAGTNLSGNSNQYSQLSGYGQTIAVVDSGVSDVPGLTGRVIQGADFTGSGPS